MNTALFIIGIFADTKLVIPLGSPIKTSHIGAEYIVRLIDSLGKLPLHQGHYLAYDYAVNHNISTEWR
jgi:hypothetical protein